MSTNIESTVITKIEDFLNNCRHIQHLIDKFDKKPIWDGELRLYNKVPDKGNHKKLNHHARIPIQVKGSSKNKVKSSNQRRFRFDKSDLIAYKNDGGVLLFFCEIKKDLTKYYIYHKFLLPYDLKILLKDDKNNSGKISVQMPLLNIIDHEGFETKCFNFVMDKKRQFSVYEYDLSIEEAEEFIISYNHGDKDPISYILSNELYLYGKRSSNESVPLVVTKFQTECVKTEITENVQLNERIFFNGYELIISSKEVAYKFNNSLSFVQDRTSNKVYIHLNLEDTFDIVLNNFTFAIGLTERSCCSIGNKLIHFDTINAKEKTKFINGYDTIEKIKTILDYFNYPYNKFNLSNVGDSDMNAIDFLYKALRGEDLSMFKFSQGLARIKICNATLLINVLADKDNYIISDARDLMNHELDIRLTNKSNNDILYLTGSPIIILNSSNIILSDNIDVDFIRDKALSSKNNKNYDSVLINLVLELIHCYDQTKEIAYLEACKDILSHIESHGNIEPILIKINKMQINKRIRHLNIEETKYLESLKNYKVANSDFFNNIQMCIGILLNDIDHFKIYFTKLSNSEQESFKHYPIYKLYKIELD